MGPQRGAANGWGATASMGALFGYWLLALSICLVRSAAPRAAAGTPVRVTARR
ncbi:hypothetical protein [Streptomyces sp. NPDC046859]|uniref:hypothetical protein n=1 Tax=Streptomyces sp. NPDC046859 TaxID=3155734 RepID=UPI0033C8E741